MFVAIMKVENNGRVAKYLEFKEEKEALKHIEKFKDRFPDAFVSPLPSESFLDWKIDKVDKKILIESQIEPIEKLSELQIIKNRLSIIERKLGINIDEISNQEVSTRT